MVEVLKMAGEVLSMVVDTLEVEGMGVMVRTVGGKLPNLRNP